MSATFSPETDFDKSSSTYVFIDYRENALGTQISLFNDPDYQFVNNVPLQVLGHRIQSQSQPL
jgi:hypothetical protein